METELVAYDYREQKWIQGEAARPLRIQQINETLAILRSPEAEHYLAATRSTLDPDMTAQQAITMLERQLAELDNVCPDGRACKDPICVKMRKSLGLL